MKNINDYTPKERVEIGRRIVVGEITKEAAVKEYGIAIYSINRCVEEYNAYAKKMLEVAQKQPKKKKESNYTFQSVITICMLILVLVFWFFPIESGIDKSVFGSMFSTEIAGVKIPGKIGLWERVIIRNLFDKSWSDETIDESDIKPQKQ